MLLRAALALLLALTSPCWADGLSGPPGGVTSVTGQTGAVWQPTTCSIATIPPAISATTETRFATTCTIPANTPKPGLAVLFHVGGLYSAGTAQNARGRVRFTQTGNPDTTIDTALIDTGSVGGLAAASNQEWYGDVWITFQSNGTSMDVQGALVFQSGAATATIPVGNPSTFPVDVTKDITLYLTVQWGAAGNSMQLRSMMAK